VSKRSTPCPDVGKRRKEGGGTHQYEDDLAEPNGSTGGRSGKQPALTHEQKRCFISGGRNEKKRFVQEILGSARKFQSAYDDLSDCEPSDSGY